MSMLGLTNLALLENLVEASVHVGCVCVASRVQGRQRFGENWQLVDDG